MLGSLPPLSERHARQPFVRSRRRRRRHCRVWPVRLAAARRGKRVVVIDRDAQANGASVRNFGFITVTGQARGEMWRPRPTRPRRLGRGRGRGRDADPASRTAADRAAARVRRRAGGVPAHRDGRRVPPSRPGRGEAGRMPAVATPELLAALWSPHELRVESRDAIPRLAAWLEARHGVTFLRQTAVLAVETARIVTSVARSRPGRSSSARATTRQPVPRGDRRLWRDAVQAADAAPGRSGLPAAAGVMSDLGLVRYAGYAALPEAEPLRARLQAEQARPARARGSSDRRPERRRQPGGRR